MPRRRSTTPRKRRALVLDRITRHYLSFGDDFFHHFTDADAVQKLWADVGELFIAGWIAEHPFTRPWAFWTFDAPQKPRRAHEPRADADDDTDIYRHAALVLTHFPYHTDPSLFESEQTYLSRLDLLTDEEKELL